MRDHGVHRVVQVLDEHLPVAVVQVAQAAAGDLQLALGRAVGEVVDRGQRVAEEFPESDPLRRQAGEDESAIRLARHLGQSRLLYVGGVPLLERNVEEGTVVR